MDARWTHVQAAVARGLATPLATRPSWIRAFTSPPHLDLYAHHVDHERNPMPWLPCPNGTDGTGTGQDLGNPSLLSSFGSLCEYTAHECFARGLPGHPHVLTRSGAAGDCSRVKWPGGGQLRAPGSPSAPALGLGLGGPAPPPSTLRLALGGPESPQHLAFDLRGSNSHRRRSDVRYRLSSVR